jgi:hypothetical protein
VLIPILILIFFITPKHFNKKEQSKLLNTKVIYNLDHIKKYLLEFKNQTGYFPESLLILTKEKGMKAWKGPFINKEKLVDPWKSPYEIFFNNNQPCVISFGPNKNRDTTSLDIGKKKSSGDDLVIFLEY